MSRFVPPKPSVDDLARVLRDLQRDIDGIRSGRLTVGSDIDMRGHRITGLAKPVDDSDAQTKIGDTGSLFAPVDSTYIVAGSVDPVLTHERLLAGSSSITLTDNGPGSTMAISVTQAFFDALYQPLDAQLTSLAGLSYTGNTLKVVRVNADETDFELASITTMTYPGAGIPNSTGSAWDTSYTTTGTGTVVALQTSPSFTTPAIGVATGTSLNLTLGGSQVALPSGGVANFTNRGTSDSARITITSGPHPTLSKAGIYLNHGSFSDYYGSSITASYSGKLTFRSTDFRLEGAVNPLSNGFVKTSDGDGTLSVDTTVYRPLDSLANNLMLMGA